MIEAWVISLTLILARTSMFVMTFPYFGSQNVPVMIRTGLVLSLTIFQFFQWGTLPARELYSLGDHWFTYGFMIGKEVVVGGILGFGFGLFLVPFRVAGEFIGQEMGLTIASITDPTRNDRGTVIGQVFENIGVMLFFLLDFHHVFLGAFYASFVNRPVGGALGEVSVEKYIRAVTLTQEWGFVLATPVACCLFFVSLILALMARAAPQLNIMNVGFVLRIGAGLCAVFIMMPEFAPGMRQMLNQFAHLIYAL
jgi:flagellar biosynthesis protein FliR